MSKLDPNDGVDCTKLAADLFDARNHLVECQTAVETASFHLGNGERAHAALQTQLDADTAGAMPDHVIREIEGQRDDAAAEVVTLTQAVNDAVAISNEANARVWNLQDEHTTRCT